MGSPHHPYLRLIWLTIALNVTYAVALSGLMLFYRGTHELLQPYKPLLKFVLIKSVVFLTFWQVRRCDSLYSSVCLRPNMACSFDGHLHPPTHRDWHWRSWLHGAGWRMPRRLFKSEASCCVWRCSQPQVYSFLPFHGRSTPSQVGCTMPPLWHGMTSHPTRSSCWHQARRCAARH